MEHDLESLVQQLLDVRARMANLQTRLPETRARLGQPRSTSAEETTPHNHTDSREWVAEYSRHQAEAEETVQQHRALLDTLSTLSHDEKVRFRYLLSRATNQAIDTLWILDRVSASLDRVQSMRGASPSLDEARKALLKVREKQAQPNRTVAQPDESQQVD